MYAHWSSVGAHADIISNQLGCVKLLLFISVYCVRKCSVLVTE